MKIQALTKEDFPEWEKMMKALFPEDSDESRKEEMEFIWNSDRFFTFIAKNDANDYLAYVQFSLRNIADGCLSSPVAYLEAIYVKPQFQRQAIGKKLIAFFENWAKNRGCKELATDTEITRLHAQTFYEKLNFEELDRVVVYRKEIQ